MMFIRSTFRTGRADEADELVFLDSRSMSLRARPWPSRCRNLVDALHRIMSFSLPTLYNESVNIIIKLRGSGDPSPRSSGAARIKDRGLRSEIG